MIQIETDWMKQAGHMIEIEVIIGTIRILEIGSTLEMIEIEVNIIGVIKETLRMEIGHMTKEEVGIKVMEEDLVGKEQTVDLGIEVDQSLEIKVKREGITTGRDQGHFIRKCQKKKRGSR